MNHRYLNAVADNIGDYLFDLHNCKDDSLLEEYDELNLSLGYTYALETRSVASL